MLERTRFVYCQYYNRKYII